MGRPSPQRLGGRHAGDGRVLAQHAAQVVDLAGVLVELGDDMGEELFEGEAEAAALDEVGEAFLGYVGDEVEEAAVSG